MLVDWFTKEIIKKDEDGKEVGMQDGDLGSVTAWHVVVGLSQTLRR